MPSFLRSRCTTIPCANACDQHHLIGVAIIKNISFFYLSIYHYHFIIVVIIVIIIGLVVDQ